MRRYLFSLAIVVLAVASTTGQQATSSEDLAFNAVAVATNPASRLAAAEDFVANFPRSTKRQEVARLVSEQLTILRNPAIALTLLDRARSIFTAADEWEQLKPAALEVYANAERVDEAFALGADILSKKPYEFWVLVRLSNLGAQQARGRKLKYADVSLGYAMKAIQSLERNERQSGWSDQEWSAQKAELPNLYQQLAIIKLAEGNDPEAREDLTKAIDLDQQDPMNFVLLGRVLNAEYERRTSLYEKMPDGKTKLEEKAKLDTLLDEVVNRFAQAAGLATGKVEYQVLLQQVIPDLTRLYRARHQSTAGLQQLINKYRQ